MGKPATRSLSSTGFRADSATQSDTTPSTTTTASIPLEPHFLVISLGNPPPYFDGFHSAGHHGLLSLQQHLQPNHSQPQFSSERIAKKATQVSRGPKYTLFQCPTLMNISGPWVAKAWKEVLEEKSHTQTPLGLVVVHDDLEQELCVVKTRDWDTSHRGHNGLKSILASMRPADYKDSRWAKIRLGIGRPEGRDHDTVSDYVLKPMSKYQKELLAAKSGSSILSALKEIEAAWTSHLGHGATAQVEKHVKPAKKGKKGTPTKSATSQ